MARIPDVVTHNYDPAYGPFGNLCASGPDEAARVLDQIRAAGRRRLKPDYLERRLATERWLHEEATRKLGPSRRHHPIYFFLGDFDDGLDPSRPSSLVLPLAHFPVTAITFTCPDSMASLPLAMKDEHAADRRPYHGQVFTLDEIRAVVAKYGIPKERSAQSASPRLETFVEMQLWDDAPLQALSPHGSGDACGTKSPFVRPAGAP